MKKNLFICLSLLLAAIFTGACSEEQQAALLPEILVSHSHALVTSETGDTVRFMAALSANPEREVVIRVRSTDLTEGMVHPSELVFDENNWFLPVAVTVTGLSDGIVDGDIEYTIELSEHSDALVWPFLELEEVDVVNLDIDVEPASFDLSAKQLVTQEDGPEVEFTLALGSEPTAEVVVSISSSDETEGTISPSDLRFNAENWAQAQAVTLTPVADGIVDGHQAYNINFAVASSDERYDGYQLSAVEVKNIDADKELEPASFKLNKTQITTREDGPEVEFTLALGSEPMAEVVVSISSSDETEGTLSPSDLRFNTENWAQAQVVTITPVSDGVIDGDQKYLVKFDVSSSDQRYDAFQLSPIDVRNMNVDYDPNMTVKIRAVAGNITSGNGQSYDEKHGIRIFQALKPDIVMIQEFLMLRGSLREMVDEAFGPEFYYTIGNGSLPNGVVSRFPIIEQGAWPSNEINNRDWDWAVIDIPGPKDILVVSVHLSTSRHNSEMGPLKRKIDEKLAEGNYYLLYGGDFNTSNRTNTQRVFSSILDTSAPYPVDQNGRDGTNASRKKPYDWVVACHALSKAEVPVVIGNRSYPRGHVFDSRVYADHNELSDVAPVRAGDSASSNMQHMAVVKDFLIKGDAVN